MESKVNDFEGWQKHTKVDSACTLIQLYINNREKNYQEN